MANAWDFFASFARPIKIKTKKSYIISKWIACKLSLNILSKQNLNSKSILLAFVVITLFQWDNNKSLWRAGEQQPIAIEAHTNAHTQSWLGRADLRELASRALDRCALKSGAILNLRFLMLFASDSLECCCCCLRCISYAISHRCTLASGHLKARQI